MLVCGGRVLLGHLVLTLLVMMGCLNVMVGSGMVMGGCLVVMLHRRVLLTLGHGSVLLQGK